MELCSENKKETKVEKTEIKQYITGAGGCIVSKSILSGTSKLKWLFREYSEFGNGWIAFGDKDTQEYIDNPKNMAIVDFNTLIDIEPTALNIFYMPVGTDLEFHSDKSGKYFIDTNTGKEIREQVKHPAQIAFEKNLKFLNQENYSIEFFQGLFQKSNKLEQFIIGETDFPSGEVVLADPLAYLGSEYMTYLERKIPVGSYLVEISICHSKIAGLRIAAARLIINHKKAIKYEIAMPKGKKGEDFGKSGAWTFFGVDTGLACFSDAKTAKEYSNFITKWQNENPGKNKYNDYFAALFQKSHEMHPNVQNKDGNFLLWQLPQTSYRLIMFTSGMGDGIYSGYWGFDADGEVAELVIPFMNPIYF
ncbi:immunity protein Imm33 domain-containing protein [Clostridioides difficile]